MNKYILLAILLSLSVAISHASVEEENALLVDSIESLARNYDNILKRKTAVIDSMKSLRQNMIPGEQRVRLGEILGRRYLTQNLDSALMYWHLAMREAEETNQPELALRLKMNILAAMPLQGISIEALREFEKIDPSNFSQEMKHIYWLNYSEIYYNIQKPYPPGNLKNYYRNKASLALDSLSKFYPVTSPVSGFIGSYLHHLRGDNSLAAASSLEVLPSVKNRPELYDYAIMNVINFYRDRPEYRALYLNNLYKRAINELQNGTAKAMVIGEVGEALYSEGNDKLGKQLMLLALQTSETELGPYSRLDHAAYSTLLHNGTVKSQLWSLVLIVVLAMVLSVVLVRIFKRRAELRTLRRTRAEDESHHQAVVADMYKVSASLLSMALFTDEQLKEYNLFVHRKLKAGQVKDLYQEVQSGEYVQSLSDKFFSMFDELFLDSFPGFVDELNSLFAAGRELSLLPGRRMSPELRIAAFMRLGINDSAKLAQVLGLSINTIYTYRNRLKGRARERDNFEKDIRNIAFNT